MEELKFGLITGVECKFTKTDPGLMEAIAAKTKIPIEQVKVMMRYNIFTVNQFSQLTQLPISSIANKTRPAFVEKDKLNTELDYCYPFSDSENEGPKFILRNEKSEKFLKA